MHLVIATRNKDKILEIGHLLKGLDIELASLADYPDMPDIAEDGETFLENARKKAHTVAKATGHPSLADDSGLIVAALGGGPGVRSARYAGRQGDYAANNKRLLDEMTDIPDENRGAEFVCTMVLAVPDGKEWVAEGRCAGIIAHSPKGNNGFGYDPLFFIPGLGKTMAELTTEEKNAISHRGKALSKLKGILILEFRRF